VVDEMFKQLHRVISQTTFDDCGFIKSKNS